MARKMPLCFQFHYHMFSGVILLLVMSKCSCVKRVYSPELQEALDAEEVKIYKLNPVPTSSLQAIEIERTAQDDKVFDIYCYAGPKQQSLRYIWTSPHFRVSPKHISGTTPRYQLYVGSNESDVYDQHVQVTQSWLNLLPWQPNTVNLEPFNNTCIGVDMSLGYMVHFQIKGVNYYLVLRLCLGLLLFFWAGKLAKNVLFYYSTGISIGIIASLLIVVFVISRFMPKKLGAGAILIGGWSLALYALQYIWENAQVLMEKYKLYVLGYFVGTTLISFAVLYYKGPITNQRAVNLIQWTLQLTGLALVYSGTQIPMVSVCFVCGLLLFYNMPLFPFGWFQSFWRRKFPPKIRLLTEEEYILQGQVETQKALEELRQYCRSPNCDAWRTLSRIKSPSKFAKFMEGESHVSEEEMDELENDPNPRLPSDEENMDTTF